MINKLIPASISLFVFLFPLFYLPITPDSYEYNKMFLLGFATLFFFLLFSVHLAWEKRFHIYKTTFGIPLLLLLSVIVLSTLFQSANKTVALTTPLSSSTIIFGILLYYLLISLNAARDMKIYLTILTVDAIVISFFVLFQSFGLLPLSPFTPAGNITATGLFLAVMTLYTLLEISRQFKALFVKRETPIASNPEAEEEFTLDEHAVKHYTALFYCGAFLLICTALIILISHAFSDQKPYILPYTIGWTILLSLINNIKTLLFGVGPTNFFLAFTLAKPLSINATPFWNVIFTTSSSYLLTLTTEFGFLAGLLYIFLPISGVFLLVKNWHSESRNVILTVLFSLILQIFLPSSMTVFILTMVLLALSAHRKSLSSFHFGSLGPTANALIFPSLFVFVLFLYTGGRWYRAETLFKESLDALLNNQAGKAYSLQTEAIGLSPDIDRYHLAHSQTGLAIANTYAAGKDTSEEDKQKIPQLVQQSINEGKIAINLGKMSINNWNNIAQLYTSLIHIAQGSEDWAKQSYDQLITLDPLNPNHRISYGGMYLRAGEWNLAEEQFRIAISLKNDFANAHYNLAYALKQEKNFDGAASELQFTLSLIPQESEDALKVKKELSDLAKAPMESTSSARKSSLGDIEPQSVKNASPASTLRQVEPTPELNPETPSFVP